MTTVVCFNGVVLLTDIEGPDVADYLLKVAEMVYYEAQKHIEELIITGETRFE